LQKTTKRPVVIREKVVTPLLARPDFETTNIFPALSLPASPGSPVTGWLLTLGDSRRQTITLEPDNHGVPMFTLSSPSDSDEIAVISAPIDVSPGMSFYPDIAFCKSTNFSGIAGITVSLIRNDRGEQEQVQQFYTQEPGNPRADGWARARRKFVIPAKGARIQLKLGGRFTGTVKIKNITLGYSAK
jgi:hypothetical protein